MRQYAASIALVTLGLAACATDPVSPAAQAAGAPSLNPADRPADREAQTGAVYTMTNAATGNQILAFRRAADGTLSPLGTFTTGGTGIGGAVDPLQSQYSIILDRNHALLFAVDPGSNTVTSFRVDARGVLTRVDHSSSGGTLPVSLALRGRFLYVLNKGNNVVHGYFVPASGRLVPLAGATRALNAGASGAATIGFSANGRTLIVTERLSNRIEALAVESDGRLGVPVITASAGATPFGFDVAGPNVIVADATAAGQNAAVSSYRIGAGATLAPRTAALDVGGQGACWALATNDGRYAYTVNAATASISAVAVGGDGRLTLVNPAGPVASTGTGSAPLDPAFSGDDAFLYVLKAGSGTIGAFRVGSDHGLSAAAADTPAGAPASGLQGLAAY